MRLNKVKEEKIMKNYVKPQLLLEKFEVEDVIMESGVFKGITTLSLEEQDDFSKIKFD